MMMVAVKGPGSIETETVEPLLASAVAGTEKNTITARSSRIGFTKGLQIILTR
ncbi:MAG: hypothetical protein QOJ59_1831 [Thermomicrobiales bacterium]|jgi:hypothetical protein|nr:hypothetical protein [Thermomicrobiales bacterium]